MKCRKGGKLNRLLLEHPLVFHNRQLRLPAPGVTGTVINLSSQTLTEEEQPVLSHGKKFACPPKKIPVTATVVRCEHVVDMAIKDATKTGIQGPIIAFGCKNQSQYKKAE